MQQIERFGVIALVFLLITIVAVSFWGDSKSPGFWSRLTGRAKQEPTADHILPPPSSTDTALTPPAPLDLDTKTALIAQNSPGTAVPAPKTDTQVGTPVAGTGADTPAQPKIAPIVPPPSTPAASNGEYVVQKGDSLALIARRTLGKESRWTEIAELNPGLTPKNLKVGAKLTLPSDAAASPKGVAAAAPKPATTPKQKPKAAESASKPKPKPEVASLVPAVADNKPRVR